MREPLRLPSKTLKVRRAIPEQRVKLVLREIPVRLVLTVRAHTQLLRPAVTRTRRRISTQILPQCKGLRQHLRLYKEVGT